MKEFEYKIGDGVLCKKNFKDGLHLCQFYSGSLYGIDNILVFDTEINPKTHTFSSTRRIIVIGELITGDNINHSFREKDFHKYFYSRKELLNKKLKKIKKIKNGKRIKRI